LGRSGTTAVASKAYAFSQRGYFVMKRSEMKLDRLVGWASHRSRGFSEVKDIGR
jgi:hypothetical protein